MAIDAAALREHSVLVVDDESDNLLFYTRVLRQACKVVEAKDGFQALELAKTHSFSAVVTDQRMPGMTGIELLAQMQELYPDVPKIIVTAYSDLSPVMLAINTCVMFGYLIKPVGADMLKNIVQRAVANFAQNHALRETLDRLRTENKELRRGNEQLQQVSARLVATEADLEENDAALTQAYEKMVDLTHRDELTQVHNRRQFVQSLTLELSRCKRYSRTSSLLLIDIDAFKDINDRHGRAVGDEVLKDIARALVTQLRVNDQVFRVGGDEFAVILPETAGDRAAQVARKVSANVLASIPGVPDRRVTISTGVQEFRPEFRSGDEWFALADADLYRSKQGSPDHGE